MSLSESNWCRIQRKLKSPKEEDNMSITILDENSYMEENSANKTSRKIAPDTKEEILWEPQRIDTDKEKKDICVVILDESCNMEGKPTSDTSEVSSNSTPSTPKRSSNSSASLPEEILLDSPGIQLLCKGSPKDGLCPVIIDTHGGPGPEPGPLYERKSRGSNKITSTETDVNSSSHSDSELKPASTSSKIQSEDFIQISHYARLPYKKRDVADETIVLGDDTIVISSEDESGDDIKIERVVVPKSSSPKKVKKKTHKRSLSAGSVTDLPQKSANFSSKRSKRKSKNNQCLMQRSTKVMKSSKNTDVSTDHVRTAPLPSNVCLLAVTPLASNSSQPLQSLPINNSHCSRKNNYQDPNSQSNTVSSNYGNVPSTSSGKYAFDNNIIALNSQPIKREGLRPVVIDARNVASE